MSGHRRQQQAGAATLPTATVATATAEAQPKPVFYTREDMDRRVAALLVEMKLAKCADTPVGGTDPLYTAVRSSVVLLLGSHARSCAIPPPAHRTPTYQ